MKRRSKLNDWFRKAGFLPRTHRDSLEVLQMYSREWRKVTGELNYYYWEDLLERAWAQYKDVEEVQKRFSRKLSETVGKDYIRYNRGLQEIRERRHKRACEIGAAISQCRQEYLGGNAGINPYVIKPEPLRYARIPY